MGNNSKQSNTKEDLVILFIIFLVLGNIITCTDNIKNDFSISSLFSKKAYKASWNKNMLVIEMPYPTKGVVGINAISWGEVDVDELVEDIYDEIKKSDYSQCLICVMFITKYKDQYGNDVEDKTNLHLIACLNPLEVRKYKNGKYLDEHYNITNRILREAFGGIE